MQQLSIIIVSNLILGYSSATSLQHCKNNPSPSFLFMDQRNKNQWREFNGYISRKPAHKKCHVSHDVGLMDSCDFVPPFLGGIVKCKLCNPLRLGSSDNLQALDDTLCALGDRGVTDNTWKEGREASTSRLPLSLPSPVSGPYLMFQGAIFPFCLFSNDYQV